MGIAMNRREFSRLIAGAAVAHTVLSHASESNPPTAPFQLSDKLGKASNSPDYGWCVVNRFNASKGSLATGA
jgi:hypothetical protein